MPREDSDIVSGMSRLVAILGRPNVGKSALFNRIVGRRVAIVHDQPGVTRDRITCAAEWAGKSFTLVDTGGIGLLRGEKSSDVITRAAIEQVSLAIAEAAVIIFVVNAREGLMPLDREVAGRLRQSGKPVVLAVNKSDTQKSDLLAGDFAALGFEQVFSISAIHDRGVNDLMNAAVAALPKEAVAAPADAPSQPGASALKLAVVGRPNVGKSSLINALTRSERVIVSPIPGTTRDAVDVPLVVEKDGVRQEFVLIDTAGVRKERRIDDSVEFFSVQRTDESIERADLVIFVLDAAQGILEQDKKIADKITRARKGCIVVINKWDLYSAAVLEARKEEIARRAEKRGREAAHSQPPTTLAEFAAWVQRKLFFLDYAPVIFTSAKDGFHLDRLLEAVRFVATQLQQRISTALLNRCLHDAIERRQPVSAAGHRLKFYYATQTRSAPPTFLLFVNRADLFSDQYAKYLEGEVRKAYGFEGCPIRLVAKDRPKTVEPVRRPRVGAKRGGSFKEDSRRQKRGPKPSGVRRKFRS